VALGKEAGSIPGFEVGTRLQAVKQAALWPHTPRSPERTEATPPIPIHPLQLLVKCSACLSLFKGTSFQGWAVAPAALNSRTQLTDPHRQSSSYLLLGLSKDAACTQGLVLQALLLRCVHVLVRVVQLRTSDHMLRAPATCSAQPKLEQILAKATAPRSHRRAAAV
jgi:hypothetical protein